MNNNTRRINLTGIHAVNWYGYTHDFIPVAGNFLLAGVMGSGKSILMDLIQHVLVGNDKCRYNASATGAKSGRSFKGYCLGDLKTEVNDVPQYFRPKGGITLIALEFTWPGGTQTETWGFRAEWANATQNAPSRNDAFFVPTALAKSELVDAETKKPLDFAAFKELVKSHAGQIFDSFDMYRKTMANHNHLNFDRDTVDYLLPSAMSFTVMAGGFNRFCRSYILPEEPLKTADVRESYMAFQKLEADLVEIKDKVRRLEQIEDSFNKWEGATRDHRCFDFLQKEYAWKAAEDAKAANAAQLLKLEVEDKENADKLAAARIEEERLERVLMGIMTLFNATGEGAVFLRVKEENRGLAAEVERLKAIGKTVDDALKQRLNLTRKWLDCLKSSPFKIPASVISSAEATYQSLAAVTPDQIRERTQALANAISEAKAALDNSTKELCRSYEANRMEMNKLRATINSLSSGHLSENSTLLNALNGELPRRNGQPAARAIRELCEVTDERWRPALEVVFAQKFVVVVSDEDYPEADRIYYGLKGNAPMESLVIPSRMLQWKGTRHPESLASKLETDHPIARAFIDSRLGDIICVERREDMLDTATGHAVLPDGYMVRGTLNHRPRHYDNRPFIGKKGIEKQKGFLQDQHDELARANMLLQPSIDTLDRLKTAVDSGRLTVESIHDDLNEAARLPIVQQQLDDNISLLNRGRAAGFEEKEAEMDRVKQDQRDLKQKIADLNRASNEKEILRVRSLQDGLDAKAGSAKAAFDLKFNEVGATLDLTRKDEIVATFQASGYSNAQAEAYCEQQANSFNTKVSAFWIEVKSFRREMADRYPSMKDDPDYEIESKSNENYHNLLQRMAVKDMEDVQRKAAQERLNWQNLFRTTVASKLSSALRKADDLIALMKRLLHRPIGNHTYHISMTVNPDREYVMYRKLLEACAAAGEEGDLFAALETDVRKDVEALFDTLVMQPDSRTALQFLDYRNYHDYDLKVGDVNDPSASPISVDKQSSKMSGGENQSPYFISILACYLRAYRRHQSERTAGPSLCLVPIDEAFSKMSGDGIRHCIAALDDLGLQGFLSMSSGNIPYAVDGCDQVLTVTKKKTRNEYGDAVRNIAVSLTREEARGRYWKR